MENRRRRGEVYRRAHLAFNFGNSQMQQAQRSRMRDNQDGKAMLQAFRKGKQRQKGRKRE